MKHSIAIYLQHFLSGSMTFIYRQLKAAHQYYNPLVLCSDKLENEDLFPYEMIFFKQRNYLRFKKSSFYQKLFGVHTLLSTNPKLSTQQFRYFKDILIKRQIRLIHAHFGPAGLEILNLARECGLPLIVTFHGYDASVLIKFEIYRRNLKALFEYAHIIAVSDYMKKKLIQTGASEEKIFVTRCGIPIQFFEFFQRKSPAEKIKNGEMIQFIQVSNLIEKKGHKYTIKAFGNFVREYPNSKLIIAGDGALRKNIERLCIDLNLSDKVEFKGRVDEKAVVQLMRQSDIFLHHSITSQIGDEEGVPTVIMEAMATGLPVISTYHSGIPELISSGIDGFLVEEKDVDGYSRILLSLDKIPRELPEKARKKIIDNFNLDIETQKLFEIYNKLIR